MGVELATKYAKYTDEIFKQESKRALLTCNDFDWDGAHTVKIWKISTAEMQDYGRTGATEGHISRYGAIKDLDAQTETMLLKKDRSFVFNIDTLDENETEGQLEAASALARQLREVVIPEIDKYVYGVMTAGAGTTATKEITATNVYDEILEGSKALDNAEVPETERVLLVSSETYNLMKKSKAIIMDTDIGAEMRLKGVIGVLDGMQVVKVAGVRLPENFGFMIAHPAATVAPVKLEKYGMHKDTVLSSGTIVTGRIAYDAFVLENKKQGIYYLSTASEAV